MRESGQYNMKIEKEKDERQRNSKRKESEKARVCFITGKLRESEKK